MSTGVRLLHFRHATAAENGKFSLWTPYYSARVHLLRQKAKAVPFPSLPSCHPACDRSEESWRSTPSFPISAPRSSIQFPQSNPCPSIHPHRMAPVTPSQYVSSLVPLTASETASESLSPIVSSSASSPPTSVAHKSNVRHRTCPDVRSLLNGPRTRPRVGCSTTKNGRSRDRSERICYVHQGRSSQRSSLTLLDCTQTSRETTHDPRLTRRKSTPNIV